MSDWDYVVGEDAYTQGFQVFTKRPKEAYDGTGVNTATITILKSDLTAATPAVVDVAMAVDTENPLRLTYDVTTLKMPQTAGNYLCIITFGDGSEVRKTYECDLRVHRG
jgi:hypothetical protein